MKKKVLGFGLVLFAFAALTFALGTPSVNAAPSQTEMETSCSEWLNVGSGSRCVVWHNGACQCTETWTVQKKYCSDGSVQTRHVNHQTNCQ